MPRPRDLPIELSAASAFTWQDAQRRGVSTRRLRAARIEPAFRGIYVQGAEAASPPDLARAYAMRMPPTQFFSHVTAALLTGMPLPRRLENDPTLHVAVRLGGQRAVGRGVVGHTLAPTRIRVVERDGLAMTDPATTFALLGEVLSVDDLIAVGDFLITGEEPRGGEPALASREKLEEAVTRLGRGRGVRRLREALRDIRFGPLSRRETMVRLLLMRGGLPEPTLNHPVHDRDGRLVALIDLAYPEAMVGIEYEGDGHRERQRFRDDIVRRELLEDLGWTIIRLTADDVPADPAHPRARATVVRVARRLAVRGMR